MKKRRGRDADKRRRALLRFMAERGLTPAEWARRANISSSSLYNFLNSYSDSLSIQTLDALARAAGVSTARLVGDDQTGESASFPHVTVIGYVEAGTYVENPEWAPDMRFEVAVPVDSAAAKRAIGLRVKGSSMNRVYPEGTIVICVPIWDFEGEITPGDRVVCRRRNRQGAYETTIKELTFDLGGRAWLWPRSDDPQHQTPIAVPWPPPDEVGTAFADEHEVAIIAIVIAAYQVESAAHRPSKPR
jgi:repressor LexA